MSDEHADNEHTAPPLVARTIRRFSVPIILAWLAITVIVSIGVPPLEQVEKEHSVSLSPQDAPSFQAAKRMGQDFKESNSDECGDDRLGGSATPRRCCSQVLRSVDSSVARRSKACAAHPEFLGDPLTAAAAQSADGKATYVEVDLAGNLRRHLRERIGASRPGHRRADASRRRGSRRMSPARRRSFRIWARAATRRSSQSWR